MMLLTTIALCASAVIVRNEASSLPEPTIDEVEDVDSTELTDVDPSEEEDAPVASGNEDSSLPEPTIDEVEDQWCCCDLKTEEEDKKEEKKMICLTDDGYRNMLEVEDVEAKKATAGASVQVNDKIVRSCVDDTPQPCVGDECVKEPTFVTFEQRERMDMKFDKDYTLPVEEWAAAKYQTKYYTEQEQIDRTHVVETESGNVYAKVIDASEYGIAKDTKKGEYCTSWETHAYWKKFTKKDKVKEKFTGQKEWTCVQKRKCVQYVTVEDACGNRNVIRGDGEEKTLTDLTKLGGELYELVGRKGQCHDPEKKEVKNWKIWKSAARASAWKWTQDKGKTVGGVLGVDDVLGAGAGSQCPKKFFHSSKGTEIRPTIPYRFCDCNGQCK